MYPAVVHINDSPSDGVDCRENIGPTGLGIIWMMVSLALIVVTVRCLTQIRVTKQFGLSDYLMICSVVIITAFASLISAQYHYGWGHHQACITDVGELETQLKLNVTGQSFGIMGSTCGRLSFIVFMARLFGSKRRIRAVLWALFAAQLVTNLAVVVTLYAQCRDPRALYDFSYPESLCWRPEIQTYLGYAHTAFNGATDLFLAVLPTVMVWNLQMHIRLKIGLAILLGMSALALVGVVMKCVYLSALSNRGDFSYNTVPMFIWIVVEGTLIDLAASIPLLRPLLKRHLGGTQGKPTNYELPRYAAARSGKSDLSGFSRLSEGGGRAGTLAVGARNDDGGSSEEEQILAGAARGGQEKGRSIVVRQEYSVNFQDASEPSLESQWARGPA